MQCLPAGLGLAVIAGEAVLHVRRRRQLIHLIAGRQRDLETIGIPQRPSELERKPSWFPCLQHVRRLASQHAGPYKKQIPRTFRVIDGLESVVETERLVRLIEINQIQSYNLKVGERSTENALDGFDSIVVL